MSVKFRNLLGTALLGASFFCAVPASAITTSTACTDITGNGVTITECSYGSFGSYDSYGSYSVLNESKSDIYKFFVSTQAPSYSSLWTSRTNWQSSYISADSWDSGDYLGYYGSFDSLFGLEDTGVFEYRHAAESQDGVILAGENTGAQFTFNAMVASEFIAIGESGTIIARSFEPAPASNVPEPGSLALLGLGIAGLAVVRRKRQSK